MSKNDLIALGLGWGRAAASPDAATPLVNPSIEPRDDLRAPAERLLVLLRDFVTVVELSDQSGLLDAIETCRVALVEAADWAEITAAIEACNNACRVVLAELDRQRLEQHE